MSRVNWVSNSDRTETFKTFFKKATEGGRPLLQPYLNSHVQKGGGLRRVSRSSIVPVSVFKTIQQGQGQNHPVLQNITPTQQVAEIARSEAKREEVPLKFPVTKKKQQKGKRKPKETAPIFKRPKSDKSKKN